KTGKSADDIKALLKEETWMNGREAVAAGFADQLTEPLQAAAHLSSKRMQEFANMPEALKTLLAPRAQTPAAPTNTPAPTPAPAAPAGPVAAAPTEADIRARILAEESGRRSAITAAFGA
ncbi:Clp protease ClpP, partial [Pseudomonas aeruginosa]|nr:Clp protease ClpP [Pseudomonas aeruginosa]